MGGGGGFRVPGLRVYCSMGFRYRVAGLRKLGLGFRLWTHISFLYGLSEAGASIRALHWRALQKVKSGNLCCEKAHDGSPKPCINLTSSERFSTLNATP